MLGILKSKKNDIKAQDVFELINNKSETEFIILDVRSSDEFNEGHIERAKNIDYNSKNFQEKVGNLDKNSKYIVYCHSGMRSSRAVKVMKKFGFTDVQNLSGGIRKWKGKNLPLSKT